MFFFSRQLVSFCFFFLLFFLQNVASLFVFLSLFCFFLRVGLQVQPLNIYKLCPTIKLIDIEYAVMHMSPLSQGKTKGVLEIFSGITGV